MCLWLKCVLLLHASLMVFMTSFTDCDKGEEWQYLRRSLPIFRLIYVTNEHDLTLILTPGTKCSDPRISIHPGYVCIHRLPRLSQL